MPSENEIKMYFRIQLLQRKRETETHKSSGNSQNLQFTPGEVNQSQDISDTYADDAEHRSTHTLSLKNVGLWKELSNKEIAYWKDRALKFSRVVDNFLVRSEGRRSNPGFAQMFFLTKVKGETYRREWLVYSPAKGWVHSFVCNSFQTMHLLRLSVLMVLMSGPSLIISKLMKTQKNTEIPC